MIDDPHLKSSDTIPLEPSEEAIRLRSQLIWEREGRPEGVAQDHWLRAKAELEAEQEHWMRAEAELAVEMEKTSTAHLVAPAGRKSDFLRAVLVQAGALIPKAAVPAAAFSPPPAKNSKQTFAAPSIISADIVLQGTLESTGDIQLDGCVDGNVCAVGLVVDTKAIVHGEIVADDVTVRGCVRGSIRARKVHLCAGSRVEGEILYGIFTADAGAQIEGLCRYLADPLGLEDAPEEPVEADTFSEDIPLSRSVA